MMVELTRTVRFAINPPGAAGAGETGGDNTFAAEPSFRGLARYYELEVTCRGPVDPTTGYFVNIKRIDQAVRTAAVPLIAEACRGEDAAGPPAALLPALAAAIEADLARDVRLSGPAAGVMRVRWRLTPFFSLEIDMTARSAILMRQQFEFAASHRLHCPDLSDQENRALFGKCNNPRGHGHNYRIEPCVEIPAIDDAHPLPAAERFGLADLERLTGGVLIDRFDHKHLNEDCAEFAELNPSVENIAVVCHDLLAPAIEQSGKRARLRSVTVWETDKTSCTYPAERR